jgi:hypothetical protein
VGGPVLVALAAALLIGHGVPVHAQANDEGFGPFPVRNFQPFQLVFLGMFGDRATVLPKRALDLRVELAETASVFNESHPQINATLKFEQLRTGVFFRYGLTDRLEVGLEVPVLYRYRGFLDGAIQAVERMTSGLSPVRAGLKDKSYEFQFNRNGSPLFNGADNQLGFGDLTFIGKYQVLVQNEVMPALALRFAVKAPTGDPSLAFGSGHPDLGVGLAAEKTIARRWILFVNLNGIFPTGSFAGFSLGPAFSSITGAEYLWSPNFSLVAQFDYYSSPYRHTGLNLLDRGVTETAIGFNYRLRPHLLWQVYGVENLDFTRDSAADFTLSTVITYRFGR